MLRMTSLFETEELAAASWLMSFEQKTLRRSQIYATSSPVEKEHPCRNFYPGADSDLSPTFSDPAAPRTVQTQNRQSTISQSRSTTGEVWFPATTFSGRSMCSATSCCREATCTFPELRSCCL